MEMQDMIGGNVVTENRDNTGFAKSDGMQIYYTNGHFPYFDKAFSVNYYDSYLPGDPFPAMVYDQVVLPSNVQQYGVSTKGLPVSSFVKNIEDDNWTKTYMYYDLKGRLIREYSQNHLGGYTNVEKRLDFSGVPSIILTQHKRLATDTERVITETFEYDNQDRLLVHKHKVDNNPEEILAQNTYNELSQLTNKKVGGASASNPLQSIDYTYNIRGWMTKVNDPDNLGNDLFGYAMKYNNPENTSLSTGRFNGNIAEIDWRTSTVANDNKRRYSFTYDRFNRLQQGIYSEPGSSLINNNNYNEQLTYDLNGNILTLKRFSKPYSGTTPELIDDLVYNYTGNRLDKITLPSGTVNNTSGYNAAQNNFSYDLNSNMISHLDKGISSINYNYLNLPNEIKTDPNIIINNYKVKYKYRSDGYKLHKTYTYSQMDFMGNFETVELNTNYLDGFQYGQSQQFGSVLPLQLQFVPTSEGYFDFTKNKYIYNYVDHLGNVRLSYFSNGSGIGILAENNYYPFGLKHEGYNGLTGNPSYQYKYNGKELQTETGMYDYGARFYMPDIGRWGVVDPLAEQYRRHSTYNYAVNNPIRFIDPDGRGVNDFVKREDGSIYWDKNANSQATTKTGETYLGKTLSFNFTSYIDGKSWDGPLNGIVDASGVKLTSTLTLTGRENDAGELTSLVGNFKSEPGETPVGEPRMYYPGEGGSNNVFDMKTTSTGINVNFEQHASVSRIEEVGLNAAGFKIVDVAQKLNINYNSSNGNLSVDAYTNIFPSASLTVSGNGNTSKLMQYNQPSFPGTHAAPLKGYSSTFVGSGTVSTKQAVYDYSYYPSRFYKRN